MGGSAGAAQVDGDEVPLSVRGKERWNHTRRERHCRAEDLSHHQGELCIHGLRTAVSRERVPVTLK